MTDTTLNRFIAQGTTAQRLAFVPSPPTPASGPTPGYAWWDTTLNEWFSYVAGAWVAQAGGGGGGGGSNYKGYQEPTSTHTAGSPGLTQGNWGGRSIILDEACTLNSMVFWGINAAPTATVQAAFYANTAANIPGNLLASSAVITGVTVGLNIITLSAPLAVTQGQALWVGAVVEVVPIFTGDASGRNAAFFATAGPAPGVAPACTYGTHPEINFWASK